uniref:very-long-chain enoyl-CoA reductase n=1 Tax=Timema californicum TaxID=61474 RepID=A0A7R9JA11_TIMCA|nr:unnamed protein product [Timema californicum]
MEGRWRSGGNKNEKAMDARYMTSSNTLFPLHPLPQPAHAFSTPDSPFMPPATPQALDNFPQPPPIGNIEILAAQGSKSIAVLQNLSPSTSVSDLKKQVHSRKSNLYPNRQALRLEVKGRTLKDEETLKSLGMRSGAKLYVKDLGPQIVLEDCFPRGVCRPPAGLCVALSETLALLRRGGCIPSGTSGGTLPSLVMVIWAMWCYVAHYVKRLLETIFVHRFSNATMPFMNLFKNCSYYWLFTAYIAYHVNHPLYTPPGKWQAYAGLVLFILCELGNLSIHVALRNLRPPGTKLRKIPEATSNPFTALFNFVSCPNYTYEFGSWLAFSIMTQCLPAGLFTLAGMYQMSVWALGKHRAYKKEFPNYPRGRSAILPFLI